MDPVPRLITSSANPSSSTPSPPSPSPSRPRSFDASSLVMDQQALQTGNFLARGSRLCDRTLQSSIQTLQDQQAYRAAAPRRVVGSPNWRTQSAADFNNYLSTSQQGNNYTLASPSTAVGPAAFPRVEVVTEQRQGLEGYAYCLDRGNGQYTRLVPADMLPPLNEIPARQPNPNGMVILPELQKAPPQAVAEMNRPVTLKASLNTTGQTPDSLQVTKPSSSSLRNLRSYLPSSPSPATDLATDTLFQRQIDRIVATTPTTPKRTKIYCDKWVHEGVCAFTQQGCKYKHEMPFDKATQHSLGLYQGLPLWFRKHQAELQRQKDMVDEAMSPGSSRRSPTLLAERQGKQGGSAAWRKTNAAAVQQNQKLPPVSPAMDLSKRTGMWPLTGL